MGLPRKQKLGHALFAGMDEMASKERVSGFSPRVHSDGKVWHLDVGSSHPVAEEGFNIISRSGIH